MGAARVVGWTALVALGIFVISVPPFREIMLVVVLLLGGLWLLMAIAAHTQRVYWRKGIADIHANRCPHCSYSLEGVAQERCPECGTALKAWWNRASVELTRDVAPGLSGLGTPRQFDRLIAAAQAHEAEALWLIAADPKDRASIKRPVLAVQFRDGCASDDHLRAIAERAQQGMNWPVVYLESIRGKVTPGRGVQLTLLWSRLDSAGDAGGALEA